MPTFTVRIPYTIASANGFNEQHAASFRVEAETMQHVSELVSRRIREAIQPDSFDGIPQRRPREDGSVE